MCGKFGDREGGAMTGDAELFDSIKILFAPEHSGDTRIDVL